MNNLDFKRLYAKYWFKMGEEWKILAGEKSGETFECISEEEHVALEQPFELSLVCK